MIQSAHTSSPLRRTHARKIALVIVGLLIACAIDMPIHNALPDQPPRWTRKDPGNFFRSGGYLPTWIFIAAALTLVDWRRAGRWCFAVWRRGAMVFAAATFAGIIAETSKLIFRRQRPDLSGKWYAFRSFEDGPFSSSRLSMPSSHAMVAFGGVFMLCRLFPAARPVLLAFAIGTAVERIASGAHYVSDTYVAAVLAWLAAALVAKLFDRPARCAQELETQRASKTLTASPSST